MKLQQTKSYVDGASVALENKDGWLHVVVEAGGEIVGYCVTVDGRDLPYQPASDDLLAALAEIEALDRAGHHSEVAADMGLIARRALASNQESKCHTEGSE